MSFIWGNEFQSFILQHGPSKISCGLTNCTVFKWADDALRKTTKHLVVGLGRSRYKNNLAWILATGPQTPLRNGARALELANQANALTQGTDPVILHTLAAALAETGRFNDARRTAQKAIELARAAGQQELLDELNGELKRYSAGLPCHD